MTKIALSEIEVDVQPELAEAVLKNNLSKEYFCWLIIKKLDKTMGNNSGKINKQKMIAKLMQITDLSRHTIARYLKKGSGIFWRFDKNNNTVYLNSFTKVCLSIGLTHIYSYNVVYNLELLEENFGICVKSLLMSAVASKTGSPVSNIGLAERCGVCKRTVQNYLNKSINSLDVAHKIENFQLLSVHDSFYSAKESIPEFIKVNGVQIGSIRIRRYKNVHWLLRQMPNSIINKTGRAKIRQDKIKLRKDAGNPHVDKKKKTYFQPGIEEEGLEYSCTLSDDDGYLSETGMPNINIFIERRK